MLKQITVDKAKPRERPYKLSDGLGLHLLVQPSGAKLWRFRYRFAGKENMLALGSFPDTSIASARSKRDAARALVADGKDPSQERKKEKVVQAVSSANTFEAIARELIDNLKADKKAAITVSKNEWLLLELAAPLANRPIKEITPAEILALLKKLEKQGKRETARRLRGRIGAVFRLAIATLRADTDPTYPLRDALLTPVVEHRAAITEEAAFGALMASVEGYTGWPTVRAALLFLALTMCRPGEVRMMRKSEVSFPKAKWEIPAARTKMRRPHDVPLSKQALAILRKVYDDFPDSDFVFPSMQSEAKPLSENALNSALRRMGYDKSEQTAHGFRSSASTILNERGYNADVIETALAHQDENHIRRTYNRARYWKERIALLQDWADLIDSLKKSGGRRAA